MLTFQNERGAAAVLLLLSVLLASGSYYLVTNASRRTAGFAAEELQRRADRLLQARQALLGYAVSYADNYRAGGAGPGHLPCPDTSALNDGNAGNDGPDPPCPSQQFSIGRFPRFTYSRDHSSASGADKRIEFYSARSLQDQQMWYAVSRSHINNPINTVVNPATRGELVVGGVTDVIAVIIEPGIDVTVSGSARPGDSIQAYLEGENADGDIEFGGGGGAAASTGGNDLVVYLTASTLMAAVRPRVILFVRRWLREYQERNCASDASGCYPSAANAQGQCQPGLDSGYLPLYQAGCADALTYKDELDGVRIVRHWFVRNQWLEYFRYKIDPSCRGALAPLCDVAIVEAAQPAEPVSIQIVPKATTTPVRGESGTDV